MKQCLPSNRTVLAVLTLVSAAITRTDPANAGAWTLPEGDTQIISSVTYSTAVASFDDKGDTVPTLYRKILSQVYAEHGLTDRFTLILDPEYAIATEGGPGRPTIHADDFAVKAGVRALIDNSFGVLSAEASYKTAGAFDMSVSANNDSGSEMELRLLYGANFKIFKYDCYADAEIAERWIAGARPNETPIDLTLGIHFSEKYTLVAQSFNIISGGDAHPPYRYYRSHKLELSILQRLWRGVYLQSGAYISPTGQNSLVERGADASIWIRF
ncbi:MAG TPA: hypothetical protein VL286_07605 [Rhizomicrobium sp.]|jgi:hypothetical protein|nr:hypothetical protein [Rhizomicrobium sp.]